MPSKVPEPGEVTDMSLGLTELECELERIPAPNSKDNSKDFDEPSINDYEDE